MDIQCANCLEARASPSCLKSPGAHVVGAGHHGRRKQERILQRNPAQVALQPFLILRQRCFAFRQHLVIQTVHHFPNRYLSGANAGPFTGGGTAKAGILLRQFLSGCLLIPEPDAPKQVRRFHLFTN